MAVNNVLKNSDIFTNSSNKNAVLVGNFFWLKSNENLTTNLV